MNDEIALAVVDALNHLNIPYIMVGALSCNFYGIPRATNDADFVVQLEDRSVTEIARALGPGYRLDPQMHFETVTLSCYWRIDSPDPEYPIEVFKLSDEEYHQERFRRKIQLEWAGRRVWLPTPEDVIVTKLRWSKRAKRPKDLLDARDVYAVQQSFLDMDYVRRWCGRHDSLELLESIQKTIPTI